MVKIAFSDFWADPRPFNPNNNFFLHCTREVKEEVYVVAPEECDLLFFGPFGNENKKYRNCRKVFYTGENIRPDLSQCNYSLTFHPDSLGGRNYRLPLWYLYIDWFGIGSYDNPEWLIPTEAFFPGMCSEAEYDRRFCAIVYGNRVRSREQAIKHLSTYKQVDVFGKANPSQPIGDGELAKIRTLSKYKFSLCYENTISPGYVTEKLLHGKVSGGIPIYYGCDEAGLDFNQECFVSAKDYNKKELIARVSELDGSSQKYRAMHSQPLFKEQPSLDCFYRALTSIFNDDLIDATASKTCSKSGYKDDFCVLALQAEDNSCSAESIVDEAREKIAYQEMLPHHDTWGCIIHYGDYARAGNRSEIKRLLTANSICFSEIVEQRHLTTPRNSWQDKVEITLSAVIKSVSNGFHQQHIGRVGWIKTAQTLIKECIRESIRIVSSGKNEYSAIHRKREIEEILRDKHVLAWKSFLTRKEKWLLVIEDDAVTTQEAERDFQRVLLTDWTKQLGTTYLYLDLAGGYPMRDVVKPTGQLEPWDERNLWTSNKPSSNTTCAYLVSRKLVERWVDRFDRGGNRVKRLPVDHLINVLSKTRNNKQPSFSVHWEPPILIHGSMSGSFQTSIAGKSR